MVEALDADQRVLAAALAALRLDEAVERRGNAASATRRTHEALVDPCHRAVETDPDAVEMRQRRERHPAIPGDAVRIQRGAAHVAAGKSRSDPVAGQAQLSVAADLEHLRLAQPAECQRTGTRDTLPLQLPREKAKHAQPGTAVQATDQPAVRHSQYRSHRSLDIVMRARACAVRTRTVRRAPLSVRRQRASGGRSKPSGSTASGGNGEKRYLVFEADGSNSNATWPA